MLLLRITNQPIKYQLEVEPAHLEIRQDFIPDGEVTREPSRLSIQTKNIQVRLDTTEMRASLNQRTSSAFAKEYASRGWQQSLQAIGDAAQFGTAMGQIQDGVTIAQLVKQRMLQQPTTYMTFIPAVGPDISWEPAQIHEEYDPGSVRTDWQIMRNTMDYVPGKFEMNILQYPKVTIEYLGEPNYVPPSASPTYEEKEA